mgnify:CR=1 FL=1
MIFGQEKRKEKKRKMCVRLCFYEKDFVQNKKRRRRREKKRNDNKLNS